jgi:hypothetical protein
LEVWHCSQRQDQLGIKAAHRDMRETDGIYALREAGGLYRVKFAAESEALKSQDALLWDETLDEVTT